MFMALRHNFIWQLRHTYTLGAILPAKAKDKKTRKGSLRENKMRPSWPQKKEQEKMKTTIIDFNEDYMGFVCSCTHSDSNMLNETELIRAKWIRESLPKGLKIKIALIDNKPIGFAHAIPIELGTCGITGKNSLAIPCLTLNYQKVYSQQKGSGIGRMLIKAIESDAEKHEKGVAILAYDSGFWFMPHSFFLKLGYTEVARKNKEVIMFKSFGITEPPFFTKFDYHPKLIAGKLDDFITTLHKLYKAEWTEELLERYLGIRN